ncbi:hypothetical protein F4780DRAFT_416278 [Xylariomycetidae sp. FL0641]|nr:hypothetical protein F4780DRAFT_416278 [Xylariomycetidae sp. FL0641]
MNGTLVTFSGTYDGQDWEGGRPAIDKHSVALSPPACPDQTQPSLNGPKKQSHALFRGLLIRPAQPAQHGTSPREGRRKITGELQDRYRPIVRGGVKKEGTNQPARLASQDVRDRDEVSAPFVDECHLCTALNGSLKQTTAALRVWQLESMADVITGGSGQLNFPSSELMLCPLTSSTCHIAHEGGAIGRSAASAWRFAEVVSSETSSSWVLLLKRLGSILEGW